MPSGASTGKHEAVELRDVASSAYGGKGVTQAIGNVEKIIGPALVEKMFDPKTQLRDIDSFMVQLDGTSNKSQLGANAILGVSMACARAGAAAEVHLLLTRWISYGPSILTGVRVCRYISFCEGSSVRLTTNPTSCLSRF